MIGFGVEPVARKGGVDGLEASLKVLDPHVACAKKGTFGRVRTTPGCQKAMYLQLTWWVRIGSAVLVVFSFFSGMDILSASRHEAWSRA